MQADSTKTFCKAVSRRACSLKCRADLSETVVLIYMSRHHKWRTLPGSLPFNKTCHFPQALIVEARHTDTCLVPRRLHIQPVPDERAQRVPGHGVADRGGLRVRGSAAAPAGLRAHAGLPGGRGCAPCRAPCPQDQGAGELPALVPGLLLSFAVAFVPLTWSAMPCAPGHENPYDCLVNLIESLVLPNAKLAQTLLAAKRHLVWRP